MIYIIRCAIFLGGTFLLTSGIYILRFLIANVKIDRLIGDWSPLGPAIFFFYCIFICICGTLVMIIAVFWKKLIARQ